MLQVRARCVARFRSLEQAGQLPADVDQRIRNQYAPDLGSGWGLEAVQARPCAPYPVPPSARCACWYTASPELCSVAMPLSCGSGMHAHAAWSRSIRKKCCSSDALTGRRSA
jgi:hypothetical protein